MPKETPRYHDGRKQKANTSALLRCLVIAYLLYLAWQLARGASGAPGEMPVWLAYTAAGVFCAASAAFGVYTWRTWRAGLKAAELTEEELEEEREEEEADLEDGEDEEDA